MVKTKMPVKISDSEWEVMRVIWTLNQTTAQEITQILADSMDWKAATVKTLLGRLVKKEVVWTQQEGKKFIYHPAVSEMETVRSATENLFSHICAKKVGETIADLVEEATLTQADIDKIMEQLQQKEPVATIACNCIPGQCTCKS
ncbi:MULTISPECIES: CopY/TcrY family copper transport repressor [Enterococcus]|uniref:Penicillinase repressor n=1 Tax=Enterococcus thailandicus TaxID=417368 RepID=A0A179EQE8_ENTTH|nr:MULTISPECIES: CopY/TcrY family copper transport repressor [Enterococcus]ASZ07032.1 CopY/TcrY family copper transport repressor [Enterococcus thailandicus]MDA3964486.1 CopY/TcrY family copper transport repressor [Enterococcus thailandicus]MDK4352337.1 CopY/TcrY family copper transport repressor [Enterococcus thailandicus]MDT2734703.1 CopY/TcrY family copper transport repressor [Enterococcus thailandicus]MDT2751162.1 CopY/TcrY family copper transport repressor [Enterococcus thailandicus]